MILLEAGDVVPADAVLIQTISDVVVDESHMTGESEDVRKSADASPVLLSGSKVLQGRCAALVVAVGMNSQMGLITKLVRAQEGEGGMETERSDDDDDDDDDRRRLASTEAAAAAAAAAAGGGLGAFSLHWLPYDRVGVVNADP